MTPYSHLHATACDDCGETPNLYYPGMVLCWSCAWDRDLPDVKGIRAAIEGDQQ